ncbi:uncharacterized protein B0P05DRAFT_628091 [Gilbertella persicaria]|uniref:uncharacterized protein n=1 Tax=Gilbertella persicaria TaxID=101096 RepID=UPI00221E592C|nr:uncharacterized protein B0P05DRAFT_628091 [Gilbertella persicaria]KAI8053654.1 hypothetical protein B0P05DRAFT_628091 [Gilbertella persicaria]
MVALLACSIKEATLPILEDRSATYVSLQRTHPLLARYSLQPLMYSFVNYHIKENAKYIGASRRNE